MALAAQTLLTSAGAAGRTVHYCYTKALLLQLTRSTVVTKGAFLLTNSSKKGARLPGLCGERQTSSQGKLQKVSHLAFNIVTMFEIIV